MQICPMCELEVSAFHKRSHVLPEWMYAENKDHLNRSISISFDSEYAKFSQNGIWGSYWCPECEKKANDPDTYASKVLTFKNRTTREAQRLKITPVPLRMGEDDLTYVRWAGLDYKNLSRFVQICVLREHLHRLSRHDEPLLRDSEFKALRFTYRSALIDDRTFPIVAYVEPDGSQYHSMVMTPALSSLGSGRAVEFKGPGFVFYLQLDKIASDFPFLQMRLQETGELHTFLRRYEGGGTFKASLPKLSEILKKFPAERFRTKKDS